MERLRRCLLALSLLCLAASGCRGGGESGRRIAPFGSVQTYNQTIVPYGPRPRGRMIGPVAPGIDLSKQTAPVDPATQPASTVSSRD